MRHFLRVLIIVSHINFLSINKVFSQNDPFKPYLIKYYDGEFSKRNTPGTFLQQTNAQGLILFCLSNNDTSSFRVIIPDISNYLQGDLDRDQIPDFVIPVHVKLGNDSLWYEYFFFLSTMKEPGSFIAKSSFELAEMLDSGKRAYFYAEYIRHGLLQGVLNEYQAGDLNCCPSIQKKSAFSCRGEIKPLFFK